MKRKADEAGFTLFEVLVGLALFSLILTFFGAAFFSLARTNGALDRVESAEEVDVVRRFIQRSLESSRTFHRQGQPFLHGDTSRITFTSVVGGEHGAGGVYESEIWLDRQGNLSFARRPLGWGPGLQMTTRVLLKGLAAFELTYRPCEPRNAPDQNHWSDARNFPERVTVSAHFQPEDPRIWRDLIVSMPSASCGAG